MNEDSNNRCKRAVKKFHRGELKEALQELRVLSDEGYAPAQCFLGWACEVGRGVAVDSEEAKRWYSAAAAAGDAVGQYYLGELLIRRGDFSSGKHWIDQAARQNYAPALYRLARLYEAGQGAKKDQAQCSHWMHKAAALGHPFAQRWVAGQGIKGREGLKGFLGAIQWFLRAPALAIKLGWKEQADENLLNP